MLHNSYTVFFFFFKQKTAYEIRPCDWSSDVCSSDLQLGREHALSPSPRAGDDLHDQVGDGAFPCDSPDFRPGAIGVPQGAAEAVEGLALRRGQLGDEGRWVGRSIAGGPAREPQRGRAAHQTFEGTIRVGPSHARGMGNRDW